MYIINAVIKASDRTNTGVKFSLCQGLNKDLDVEEVRAYTNGQSWVGFKDLKEEYYE